MRESRAATLTDFPLGADGTATVSVEQFSPFTDGATAVVMEDTGPRALALPDQRYYRGKVAGDASSLVVLIAGADTARGLVSTGGQLTASVATTAASTGPGRSPTPTPPSIRVPATSAASTATPPCSRPTRDASA